MALTLRCRWVRRAALPRLCSLVLRHFCGCIRSSHRWTDGGRPGLGRAHLPGLHRTEEHSRLVAAYGGATMTPGRAEPADRSRIGAASIAGSAYAQILNAPAINAFALPAVLYARSACGARQDSSNGRRACA